MDKDTAQKASQELRKYSSAKKAEFLPSFFKTGKGEYGEGDIFIGVTVPNCRLVAKKFSALSFTEVEKLLKSRFHEERLTALFILVNKFQKGDISEREKIFRFYSLNREFVNNWDLVDASVYKIVGDYLLDKDRKFLYLLAKSTSLWERRMAIVATYAFIKEGQLDDTFKISKMLLKDKEDLIHKAVGWMLREAGKRDQSKLKEFLNAHYNNMPRTSLRYAIEKFPEMLRQSYLKGTIDEKHK